ncbi:hypothetical protein MW334_003539 [Vibrio parahaemolyticus]|nr:hypothetical protein [Vibrio parahaemolyticus]EJB8408352.1 hypothetical protein [Vibrio parahaemolyticus]
MKRFHVWLYLVFTGLVVFRAITNGQELIAYFDLTSVFLVLIPSVIVYLANRSEKWVIKATIKTSIIAGFFGLALGLVLTFSKAVDVESAFVGVSVSMLPLLYSLLISIFLYPIHLMKR